MALSPGVLTQLQALGSLSLLMTLCLTTSHHGLIIAPPSANGEITSRLSSLCDVLALSSAVLDCSKLSLDTFRESILTATPASSDDGEDLDIDTRRVADVLVLSQLELASEAVQVQVLELIERGRAYTRSALHLVGRIFCVIALVDDLEGLNRHLRDRFAVAHRFEDGSEASSLRSVGSDGYGKLDMGPGMRGVVEELRHAVEKVTMTPEVSAYAQNVVVAMRVHRYVAGGISAQATRHLRAIAKGLAVLHGLDYVMPALVALAARKVYLHRLVLADEHTERSLRWGGDPLAVRYQMKDVDVEAAIDAVIESVPSPL